MRYRLRALLCRLCPCFNVNGSALKVPPLGKTHSQLTYASDSETFYFHVGKGDSQLSPMTTDVGYHCSNGDTGACLVFVGFC